MKRARTIAMGAGLTLCLTALGSHRIGLSSSTGLSEGKVLMALAGGGIFVVALLGRRSVEAYRLTATTLLTTLLMLLGLELTLLVWERTNDLLGRGTQPLNPDLRYIGEGRSQLPYFQQQAWSKDYWSEYDRAWENRPRPYSPYVLWTNDPFHGKTLNIEEDGARRTPGAQCEEGSYRVHVFGGSGAWGTGVPDWGTVAAFVQQGLSGATDRPVCVTNYAEQGFVSTQEVIRLLVLLQSGKTSDAVVFLDGVNDVWTAFETGSAGDHHNLESIRAKLEGRSEGPKREAALGLVSRMRIARKLQRVGDRLRPRHRRQDDQARRTSRDLARRIGETYVANIRFVEAVANEYGFEAFFFLQPVLLLEQRALTEEEAALRRMASSVYPGLDSLYTMAYEVIRESKPRHPTLHDLSAIFRTHDDFVFIDPWHVTMEGNRLIGQAMVSAMRNETSTADEQRNQSSLVAPSTRGPGGP